MVSPVQENAGLFTRGLRRLMAFPENTWHKVVENAKYATKLAKDDPRKIIHSLKLGLVLTLVSLFYYIKPLYDGFGVNAIWAVLTVVVVFEFSVGATLGKGLNRMLGTLVAGALAIKAHWIATRCGDIAEPILIATFVFVVAAIVTFIRFFPKMKARYDYGLMIFILTFTLISVSGYRTDEVLSIAQKRFTTIAIGSVTSIIVCTFICPVWIGEELHNLVAANIEKLGSFLEGFGGEYFRTAEDHMQVNTDKSFLQGYKSFLHSKATEETMANLARWEPCHGRFKFRHPWKQYLKVATLTRQCAHKIDSLNSYLCLEVQTPMEIRSKIQETCTKTSSETGKALKEIASSVKTMTRSSLTDIHISNSRDAAQTLKTTLKTGLWEDAFLLDIIPAANVASLLIDIVKCTELIAESVEELSSLANFRSANSTPAPQQPHIPHAGKVKPVSDAPSQHVITIDLPSLGSTDTRNPPVQQTVGREILEV